MGAARVLGIIGLVFLGIAALLLAIWGIWYLVWRSSRYSVNRNSLKNLHVFPHVDTNKYLGLWYEHFRINSWFEPADFYNVTAEYSLLESKLIKVVNSASNKSDKRKISNGTAAVTDTAGVLDVSFFAPFSGLYVILGLRADDKDDYTYAIVGSPSRDFLWLLGKSRDAPSEATVNWLRGVAAKNGYALDPAAPAGVARLVAVSQR